MATYAFKYTVNDKTTIMLPEIIKNTTICLLYTQVHDQGVKKGKVYD